MITDANLSAFVQPLEGSPNPSEPVFDKIGKLPWKGNMAETISINTMQLSAFLHATQANLEIITVTYHHAPHIGFPLAFWTFGDASISHIKSQISVH